jgi:hypothetical protein
VGPAWALSRAMKGSHQTWQYDEVKDKGTTEVQLKEVGGKPWPGRTETAYKAIKSDELAVQSKVQYCPNFKSRSGGWVRGRIHLLLLGELGAADG